MSKGCDSVLVDSDGTTYECVATGHDKRSERHGKPITPHKAGSWWTRGDGKVVPVELRWGEAVDDGGGTD